MDNSPMDRDNPALWHPDRVAAATIYGEARGEGHDGQVAVAWVIRNRAERPGWWGHDVASVCLKPFQFSCWNRNDPNRAKLLAVSTLDLTPFLYTFHGVMQADPATDPTHGAVNYVVTSIMDRVAWTKGREPSAVIGHHSFFRDS